MTTQENNKIIAEFMGVKIPPQANFGMNFWKYHNSWDWLIPVIEEIDHLEYESELLQKINNGLMCRNLENTYSAVIEFIKNFKKQKSC